MSQIYKFINRLSNSQRRLMDSLLIGREYSGAQCKLMHYLFSNEGRMIYQKEIEKIFGLRASMATELLNALEKRGLIRREPSKEDGRYKEIVLTSQAEQYRETVLLDVERLEAAIRSGISEEAVTWIEITRKMLAGLEERETEHER